MDSESGMLSPGPGPGGGGRSLTRGHRVSVMQDEDQGAPSTAGTYGA